MARDRALLERQRRGDPPVLRLYRWSPPAVSIGYHQDQADFPLERARVLGWDVVRRPTGGRAILHAEELTYAVVAGSPSPLFGSSLHSSYARINEALLAFLSDLGIAGEISSGESRAEARGTVCFQSAGQYEVRVGGRKLVGSAQRRSERAFLQHGSILFGPAHADLVRCLAVTGSAAGSGGGSGGGSAAGSGGGSGSGSGTGSGTGGNGIADPAVVAARRHALLDATTDLGRLLGRAPDAPFTAVELERLEDRLEAAFARAFALEPVPWSC
ncbi:MAG: biotin/lipoate A/B protein ligase family protein [Candidatus Krumholzibacteriia bacterium]